MKTVNYKGLQITGDDNRIDDLLYHLDHIDVRTVGDGRSFSDIVNVINELNSRFIPEDLTLQEKTDWTKQFILCMQAELSELLEALPWKHWKDYTNYEPNEEAIKYEISDLFIFLVGIALIWEMDGREMLEFITNKMNINFERQNQGY